MADRISQAVARTAAWCSTRPGSVISTVLVAAVAVWLALPALFIPYSEGFQPQVVLNAHALALGDPGLGDLLYPFNGRFFLLTRLGTSLAVLGLQRLGDLSGLAAFRLLGIGSLLMLVAVLLALLWRVYRVGPARALLCCVLFPPIFESAYLPNDDMPSAALACLALLLFWTRPTLPRTAAAGLLLGLAALVRLDAALIAPAFAILLLTEVEGWGARAVRACIASVLVLAVPAVTYRLLGLSFPDTFAAVSRATLLWDRPHRPLHNDVVTLLNAVAILGGMAWLLGVASFVRKRQWRELGLAVAVPLLYVVAYRSQLVEGRYLLPLSPFILLAMAEGLGSVALLAPRKRVVALAALMAGLAVWLMPPPPGLKPSRAADDEGPRLVLGRGWNPVPTLWWQNRLRDGQAAVIAGIERAAALPHSVIVTGSWTGDRLTALMLLEHGFTASPGGMPEACRGIAERWVRGPADVLLIRTHIPFLHHSEGMTWQVVGLPCVQAARPDADQVLVVNAGLLDGAAAAPDAPGAVFAAAGGGPPPLVPGMASMLAGVSTAVLPLGGVSAALNMPHSPEEQQAAAAAITNRSRLLQ
jgi:hypothetical protein